MKLPSEGKLLRIFIGEADKWKGKPLYEEIILLAKKNSMAGATAVKGFMGNKETNCASLSLNNTLRILLSSSDGGAPCGNRLSRSTRAEYDVLSVW